MGKTILLGISSGIAAYKSQTLITLLKKEGMNVVVIMTKHAMQMVPPSEFEKLSDNKIYTDLFEENFDYRAILQSRSVDHITLANSASLMVIAPATANTIAKLAYGIADDFLTTTALAVTAPIIVCPSMNVNMWHNPIVQENVTKLRNRGFQIIEPTSGMLACGYEGQGRLADVEMIYNEIFKQLQGTTTLKGQKIIITTGGTQEKIDDVRFITNRSSGKMGVALAEECFLRGADVLLLRATSAVKPRYKFPEETFTTANELSSLLEKHSRNYDWLYHTAAVSDFALEKVYTGKLPSKDSLTLTLKPQRKLVNEIKKLNPTIKLIAFKAEYAKDEKTLMNIALEKMRESGADAIIANDISKKDRGFEADTNEVLIILPDQTIKKISLTTKNFIAKSIIDYCNDTLS